MIRTAKLGGTGELNSVPMGLRVFLFSYKEGMEDERDRFYISTPIITRDRLHIGHAYTTVVADSMHGGINLPDEKCFSLPVRTSISKLSA